MLTYAHVHATVSVVAPLDTLLKTIMCTCTVIQWWVFEATLYGTHVVLLSKFKSTTAAVFPGRSHTHIHTAAGIGE